MLSSSSIPSNLPYPQQTAFHILYLCRYRDPYTVILIGDLQSFLAVEYWILFRIFIDGVVSCLQLRAEFVGTVIGPFTRRFLRAQQWGYRYENSLCLKRQTISENLWMLIRLHICVRKHSLIFENFTCIFVWTEVVAYRGGEFHPKTSYSWEHI